MSHCHFFGKKSAPLMMRKDVRNTHIFKKAVKESELLIAMFRHDYENGNLSLKKFHELVTRTHEEAVDKVKEEAKKKDAISRASAVKTAVKIAVREAMEESKKKEAEKRMKRRKIHKKIMAKLDDVKDKIPDGSYLAMANHLKQLHGM